PPPATGDDDAAGANQPPAEDDEPPPDGAEKFVEDFQIDFARDLLQGATAMHRRELMQQRHDWLAQRKGAEEQKIAGALAKLNIDWSTGPRVTGARLVAHITTDKPQNKVTAGDAIAVTGTVTNSGTAPAYQVHARAKNDDWTFEGAELVFGKIDPGQTKPFTAYIKTAKDAETRIDQVEWEFTEQNGTKVDAPVTNVAIEGLPRPQFAYAYQL